MKDKNWASEHGIRNNPASAAYHSPNELQRLVTVACFQLLDYILCYCMFIYICLHYHMSETLFSVVFTYQTQISFKITFGGQLLREPSSECSWQAAISTSLLSQSTLWISVSQHISHAMNNTAYASRLCLCVCLCHSLEPFWSQVSHFYLSLDFKDLEEYQLEDWSPADKFVELFTGSMAEQFHSAYTNFKFVVSKSLLGTYF